MWDKIRWMTVPQRIGAVLWISFLMAAVATGAFFSAIDPFALQYCINFPDLPRIGAYTIGFFLFWLLTASSCLLSVFFVYPSKDDPDRTDAT